MFFRHLTPNDESLTGGCRLPDDWRGESVAFEARTDWNIAPPSGLADDSLWDACIILLNSPDIAFIYAVRQSGSAWPTEGGVGPGNWRVVGFPSVMSGCTGAGETPVDVPPTLGNYADSYRGVFKGSTVTLVASRLYDEGLSYSCQFSQQPSREIVTLNSAVQEAFLGLPIESDQMIAKTSGTVLQEARAGSYMPLFFSQPTHNYQPGTAGGLTVRFTDSSGKVGIPLPRAFNAPDGQAGNGLFNAAIDLNLGVQLFVGLNKHASLNVKVKQGLEAIPVSSGPWTGFTETSPPLDRQVMDATRMVESRMALAYPASYNSLGWLLGAIGNIVRTIAPGLIDSVGGWLKGKAAKVGVPPNLG